MTNSVSEIEGRIINCAKNLFIQRGYEKVDLKLIAKKCDISVGTIYNYFPSKSKLLIKTLNEIWNFTFFKLKDLTTLKEEKLEFLIKTLYQCIYEKETLKREIIKADLAYEDMNLSKNIITSEIWNIIESSNLQGEFFNDINNLDSLIKEMYFMIKSNGNEKNNNLKILYKLSTNYIKDKEIC